MAEMDAKPALTVLLCSPRGFCAGVVRAIDSVERALALYGPPVYVRHEIVHNRYVVDSLRAKGAIFVEELDEIPETTAPVIFSAHGVAKLVPDEAARRNLFALDAASFSLELTGVTLDGAAISGADTLTVVSTVTGASTNKYGNLKKKPLKKKSKPTKGKKK